MTTLLGGGCCLSTRPPNCVRRVDTMDPEAVQRLTTALDNVLAAASCAGEPDTVE